MILNSSELTAGMFVKCCWQPKGAHSEDDTTDLAFTPNVSWIGHEPLYTKHGYISYGDSMELDHSLFYIMQVLPSPWETRERKGDDRTFLVLGPHGVGIMWLLKDEYVEMVTI